jgi:hypothetical protein
MKSSSSSPTEESNSSTQNSALAMFYLKYYIIKESVFGMDLDHTVLDTLIQWRRPAEFFT